MKRPNVLYIVHRFPYPPDKGDRIRAFHIIRYLASRTDLRVAALDDEGASIEQISELKQTVPQLEVVPVKGWSRVLSLLPRMISGKSISESFFSSKELYGILKQWSQDIRFDAVVISASSLARYLDLFRCNDTARIVDFVDVDSEKWRQYAASAHGLKRLMYQREYRRIKQLEERLLNIADSVTLVSEDEASLLRHQFSDEKHRKKIRSVTNGVDLEYFSPDDVQPSRSICFLGAMDYRPNVDAVVWFSEQVWPHLRKNHPDLVFNVVGRNPTAEVNALRKIDGIHITGAVPDVRPWLAQSLAVVAPLRIARGVQNKVLEAMSMGRAVVASPQALTGLSTEPGQNVLAAVTPDDWYYQIRKVLQSCEIRRNLELAARSYVEQHHSWEATLEPLNEILSLASDRRVVTL